MAYSQAEELPSADINLEQVEDGGVALCGRIERSELADCEEIKSAGVETRPNSSDPLPPSMPVEIIGSPDPLSRKSDAEIKSKQIQKSAKHGLSVMKFCMMSVLAAFGFWLYFQMASLLRFALECDGWRLYVALAMFAVPVVAILWAITFVLRIVLRRPRFEQVCCSKADGSRLLRQKLCDGYLRQIKMPEYISECDFAEDEGKKVKDDYDRLVDKFKIPSDQAWFDRFLRFQEIQESQAKTVVKKYCTLIGLKTAMCPWKIIDVVCVLINTTLMVSRIASIFNRRISSIAASRLVIHWCANLYISGELGEVVEKAASSAGQTVADAAKEQDWFGDGNFGDFVGHSLPTLSKWVGKVAEGATNAYLACRIGKLAIEEFKAVNLITNGRLL